MESGTDAEAWASLQPLSPVTLNLEQGESLFNENLGLGDMGLPFAGEPALEEPESVQPGPALGTRQPLGLDENLGLGDLGLPFAGKPALEEPESVQPGPALPGTRQPCPNPRCCQELVVQNNKKWPVRHNSKDIPDYFKPDMLMECKSQQCMTNNKTRPRHWWQCKRCYQWFNTNEGTMAKHLREEVLREDENRLKSPAVNNHAHFSTKISSDVDGATGAHTVSLSVTSSGRVPREVHDLLLHFQQHFDHRAAILAGCWTLGLNVRKEHHATVLSLMKSLTNTLPFTSFLAQSQCPDRSDLQITVVRPAFSGNNLRVHLKYDGEGRVLPLAFKDGLPFEPTYEGMLGKHIFLTLSNVHDSAFAHTTVCFGGTNVVTFRIPPGRQVNVRGFVAHEPDGAQPGVVRHKFLLSDASSPDVEKQSESMRTNEEPGPYAFRVDTRFVQIRASNAEGNFATVPGSEEPIFMVPGQPDKPPETTFGIEGMGVNVFLQQDLDKRSNQRFVYAKRAFKPAPDVPEESVKARVCAVAASRAAASADAAARDRGKRQAPDKSLGRDKKVRYDV